MKTKTARKYGNLLGRSFQIIDDIIDADQDEDNKNILNYMSKIKLLHFAMNTKMKEINILLDYFQKNTKLSEMFSYIINQADN